MPAAPETNANDSGVVENGDFQWFRSLYEFDRVHIDVIEMQNRVEVLLVTRLYSFQSLH